MTRVLLADNHDLVRRCILHILAGDPRVVVVGEASDFPETVKKAQKTRPDVLILDLHMPLDPGVSISDLHGELSSFGARILGISFATDDDARSLATHMGAVELLDKTQLGKELIPSIMRVASAGNCFPPAVSVKPSDRSAV